MLNFKSAPKTQSGRGPSSEHFWQVWPISVQRFQRRIFKCEKLTDGQTDAYPWQKLTWPMARWANKNWSKGRTAGHIFGREPSNDYFIQILFLLSKWFHTRRFLCEFPIGSYVKLRSAVVAILVFVLKCRTQFWKRTAQESFQQSLVEIGSVVSEEKIFF